MKGLNFNHLYYFWVVAQEQSFTLAAKRLRVAQSAVSHQVALLESFLGQLLFIRKTSMKPKLTEQGHLVFSYAALIFNQGQELVDSITNGSNLTLIRIGSTGGLSRNLQVRFLRPLIQNPECEIQIDVFDSETLHERLNRFEIDAFLSEHPFPDSIELPLTQKKIAQEPICIVGRARSKAQGSLKQWIADSGIYLPAKNSLVTAGLIDEFKKKNWIPRIRGYVNDIATLRLLTLETQSFVAIPRVGVERDLQAKTLKVYHQYSDLVQSYYLILRKNGMKTSAILDALTK